MTVPMTPSSFLSLQLRRPCFSVIYFWRPQALQGPPPIRAHWMSIDAPFHDGSNDTNSGRGYCRFCSFSFLLLFSQQIPSSMASVFLALGWRLCRQNRHLSSHMPPQQTRIYIYSISRTHCTLQLTNLSHALLQLHQTPSETIYGKYNLVKMCQNPGNSEAQTFTNFNNVNYHSKNYRAQLPCTISQDTYMYCFFLFLTNNKNLNKEYGKYKMLVAQYICTNEMLYNNTVN